MNQFDVLRGNFAGDGDCVDGYLPWMINKDLNLLAVGPDKTLQSVAEVICEVAKRRGVTELRMIDHSLRPKAWFDLKNCY